MMMASSTRDAAARGSAAAKIRTCAGCAQTGPAAELVRVVLGPDAEVAVDLAGGSFGRGAWVHPTLACIEKAAPRGLSRAFHTGVKADPESLARQISEVAEQRIGSLIGLALRADRLAVGGDAVEHALELGRVRLLVVAEDARAAAELPRIARAAAGGLALIWGSKQQLGTTLRRAEVGVLGILDDGFSRAMSRAIGLARLSRQRGG
jgi:hypothetical protein